MTKKIKVIIFIFSFLALGLGANFVLAQGADFGLEPVTETIDLAQSDPRVIIGRIIQVALSFLGAIALFLIMYAGFQWMTSGGDQEKLGNAKKMLRNAVIGLIIVLSSWAITTFILTKLFDTIGGTGGSINSSGGRNFVDSGVGAIGACTIDAFYPENGQPDVPRNTSIMVSFKERISLASLCVNNSQEACNCDSSSCNKLNPEVVRIYKSDLGDACSSGSCPKTNANITDVTVSVSSDNKTMVLMPATYLGDPAQNIWYAVKITGDLRKEDGTSMFKNCDSNYFNWKFQVGTRLDLTPPQVAFGNIFPLPDNENDVENQVALAVPAQGAITVNACPNTYKPAMVLSVSPIGNTPEGIVTPLNYRGTITKFKVVISSDSRDRAQLFDGNSSTNLLGSGDFDAQGNVKFASYFILKATDRNPGNSWEVSLSPEQLADTIKIGEAVYTFSNAKPGNNNIIVPGNCEPKTQASQIYSVLSGDPLVNVGYRGGSTVTLTSKVAGTAGDKISLSTTNQAALQVEPLKGGRDRQDLAETKDKKDVPMNTVIQVNFSEAVNPLRVAGLASEVANYIRVVNYDTGSKTAGSACTKDADCRSYKCEGSAGSKTCLGNYVAGKFLVSNAYRTVEFVSDNECGVNGCGEKIYCLPANSHLAVEMVSSDLKTCATDTDCAGFAPFKTCAATSLGYKTCQNFENKNYPTATSTLNGIVDAAINSFDGDRDIFADGPIAFYNDNFKPTENLNKKDNYRWSFYVNDKVMLTPPQIESVTPAQGLMGVNLADPIRISWNTLMMNSTLTTGSRIIQSGDNVFEHKLINLRSSSPSAVGYWILNDNIDTEPLDGEPDKTVSWINHSPLAEAMSYRAQVGSGVRDIYQNCFKPSAGVNCPVTATNPSCCFGAATSTLGPDGNCQ